MIQSIQHAYCLGYIKRLMVDFMLERERERERGERDMQGQGERDRHTQSARERESATERGPPMEESKAEKEGK